MDHQAGRTRAPSIPSPELAKQLADPLNEVDYAKQRADQEMLVAFHALARADQIRDDKVFMEKLRGWLREKRAEIDQQLNRIGL